MVSIKLKQFGLSLRKAIFDHKDGVGKNSVKHVDNSSSTLELHWISTGVKFPNKLIKNIAQVLDTKNLYDGEFVNARLMEIDEILNVRRYSFKNRRLKNRCRSALLALWNHLYLLLENNSKSDENQHFLYKSVVGKIVDRSDFNLEGMDELGNIVDYGNQSMHLSDDDVSEESQETNHDNSSQNKEMLLDLKRYRSLLVCTFQYVMQQIQTKKKIMASKSMDTLFFTKVLAVAFVRIPMVHQYMKLEMKKCADTKFWHKVPCATDQFGKEKPSRWPGPSFTQVLDQWSEDNGITVDTPVLYQGRYSELSYRPSFTRKSSFGFSDLNPTLFAWDSFVPYVENIPDEKFTLNGEVWVKQYLADGELFFYFATVYCQHIKDVAQPGIEIPWSQLPGYSLIMRTSMLILKEACWRQWWDMLMPEDRPENSTPHLEDTSCFHLTLRGVKSVMENASILLINPDLMDPFVLALYEGTNLYEPRSVGLTLHHLGVWSSAIATPSYDGTMEVPASFSGAALVLGFKPILRTENFDTLKKALLFLYNSLDLFVGELRQRILKVLLTRHYSLFLHWHAEVRSYYHHILVYKIANLPRNALLSVTDRLLLDQHASSNITPSESETTLVIEDPLDHSSYSSGISPHTYTDRAHWKAFDACIGLICTKERIKAKRCHRIFQFEREAASNRSIAFQNLCREIPQGTSVNESRPTPPADIRQHVEKCTITNTTAPPYYLRYLATTDIECLEDLCSILQVGFPPALEAYAPSALHEYTVLLAMRYDQEKGNTETIHGPALGFC